MTIKQLEARLDMTRANIRFYEAEGLLHPVRLPNGYRDYSEQDCDTLKKIKLLRQLRIPVDEIRALQNGECALGDALQRRVDELAREQSDLQQASALCRAVLSDGATWQSLDADRYLSGAAALAPGRSLDVGLSRDVPRACPHPWRRFLARGLDFSLCALVWQAALILIFRVNPALRSPLGQLFDSFAALLIQLFVEPLFLRLWGFTPGKFLFGLRVTDHGRKLSYFDALCRTGSVLASGEGLLIPIYSLVRNYKCYKQCKAGVILPWEEDFEYELTDTAPWRIPSFAAACLCAFGLLFTLIRLGQLPLHRGALTAADFAENVNDYADYLGAQLVLVLDAGGRWQERPGSSVFHTGALESYPDFTLTEAGGELTGVSFTVRRYDEPLITPVYINIMQLAALSYVCAQPGVGVFSDIPQALTERIAADPFSSFCFEMAGVELRCDVQFSGYMPRLDPEQAFLWAEEEQSGQTFCLTFSMTKTG